MGSGIMQLGGPVGTAEEPLYGFPQLEQMDVALHYVDSATLSEVVEGAPCLRTLNIQYLHRNNVINEQLTLKSASLLELNINNVQIR